MGEKPYYLIRSSILVILLFIGLSVFGLSNNHPRNIRSTDETSGKNLTKEKVQDFLERFGYFEPEVEENPNSLVNDNKISKKARNETEYRYAIIKYQVFNGLHPTGIMDHPTIEMMKKPRCGFADFHSMKIGWRPDKWSKNEVHYSFLNYTGQLPQRKIKESARISFEIWSKIIPLRFVEDEYGNHISDITLSFERGEHGDTSAFDGEGDVLAHALKPPFGTIHFDDDERWTFMNAEEIVINKKTDLLWVMLHEIGHAIGLEHTPDMNSVMHSAYKRPISGVEYKMPVLHYQDRKAAQTLYGIPESDESDSDSVEITTRRPTTRPETPSSGIPTFGGFGRFSNDYEPKESKETRVCPSKIDLVVGIPGVCLLLFSSQTVYELSHSHPTHIHNFTRLFPNGPKYVKAAYYDAKHQQMIIINGNLYYVYKYQSRSFHLIDGYPVHFSTNSGYSLSGIVKWSAGSQLLFSTNDELAIYDKSLNRLLRMGKLSRYFPSLPTNIIGGVVCEECKAVEVFTPTKSFVYHALKKTVIGEEIDLKKYLGCKS